MGFPNTHPAMLGRWSLHISRTLRATGCRGTVAFDASVFVSSSYFPMDIASWQQFSLSRLEPAQARVALAPWAMAISARVVGDGSRMSAAGATVAMPAQRGGAAARNGQQHFSVLPVDPLAAVFEESLSSTANDVGHLQKRPAHELCLCPPFEENVSASSGLAVALRCRWDRCRSEERRVAKEV